MHGLKGKYVILFKSVSEGYLGRQAGRICLSSTVKTAVQTLKFTIKQFCMSILIFVL